VRNLLRDHGWLLILVILFGASWAGQLLFQMMEFATTSRAHGEPPRWAEFWPEFWSRTLENWQSEFLQLAFATYGTYKIVERNLRKSSWEMDKDDLRTILRAIEDLKENR